MDKSKSLILIDDANLYYGFKKHRWVLDYEKLYHWFNNNFHPIGIYFFGGVISKKTFFDRHPTHTLTGFIKYKEERKIDDVKFDDEEQNQIEQKIKLLKNFEL